LCRREQRYRRPFPEMVGRPIRVQPSRARTVPSEDG
jgi:hypothetical protein